MKWKMVEASFQWEMFKCNFGDLKERKKEKAGTLQSEPPRAAAGAAFALELSVSHVCANNKVAVKSDQMQRNVEISMPFFR